MLNFVKDLYHRRSYQKIKGSLTKFATLGLLGTTTALISSSSVMAAELIKLTYQDRTVDISILDLKRFAETGSVPLAIQNLFDTTDKVPEFLSGLLAQDIKIDRNFIDDVLDSSIGEFLLGELDSAINESSDSEELNAIKSAVTAAYNNDNRVSLIEIIEKYPVRNLAVDVTDLEDTYYQVSGFVESVLPALETAKSFLQDIICECETTAIQDSTLIANHNGTLTYSNGYKCKLPKTPTSAQQDLVSNSPE